MKKLFCIPYLGGTGAAFDELIKEMNDSVEVIKLEYAGHGTRRGEDFYSNYDEMVNDSADQINRHLTEGDEFAILGYSLGALVAYEILKNQKLSYSPKTVFYAAQIPPHLFTPFKVNSGMEDEEFVKIIIEYGWVDGSLFSKRRFWPILLKTLREDLRIRETYRESQEVYVVDYEISVLYNQRDIEQSVALRWQQYTRSKCNFYEIGSTHMFLHTHSKEIAQVLEQ